MYDHMEKRKEKKSRAVANSVGQKKRESRQGFGFVDNRKKTNKNMVPYTRQKKAIKTERKPDNKNTTKPNKTTQRKGRGIVQLGEGMKVDAEPPPTYSFSAYHGTALASAISIITQGINPPPPTWEDANGNPIPLELGPGFYVTQNRFLAVQVARIKEAAGSGVLLEIQCTEIPETDMLTKEFTNGYQHWGEASKQAVIRAASYDKLKVTAVWHAGEEYGPKEFMDLIQLGVIGVG